ncbi:hypothetical protein P8631_08205 [Guyparkeria sp. 1SP6A2]|nr:hypothetical protein [Guyparkeria sp. 1SP6A2]
MTDWLSRIGETAIEKLERTAMPDWVDPMLRRALLLARLAKTTRTAPAYRFYALPGGPPERPGMIRVTQGGAAIDVEVWHVPAHVAGRAEQLRHPASHDNVHSSDCGLLAGAARV